jgi:acetyl-CoA decarbonylase/synthase complex subunit gamma
MKVATKTASIEECPDASDEAKAQLGAAAEPPIRTVRVGPDPSPLTLGGETVCYRHEKTFINRTAIGVGVQDTQSVDELKKDVARISAYEVNRVGERLGVDMVWLRAAGGDFLAAARTVRDNWAGAAVLESSDPQALRSAAEEFRGRRPVLFGATEQSLDALVAAALDTGSVLALSAGSAEKLADLAERAAAAGLRDLMLHVDDRSPARRLEQYTIIRRAALRRNFRPLGYPVLMSVGSSEDATTAGVIGICKYASAILLSEFDEALLYPLLTLRQGIYTDPQKPIQVEPGVYPVGSPGPESPVFLTTNFSLTYFLVSGEIENSGISGHLVVHDCEGMSVLTAWAAGKFSGEKVASFIKASELPGKETGRTLVIPGYAAMISGELEEGLPGFRVLVGPREAVDIPAYVKQAL